MFVFMMVLTMSIPVLAANSPSSPGVVQEVVSAVDASGRKINMRVAGVSPRYAQAVQTVKNKEELKTILGNDYKAGMDVYDVREIVLDDGTTPTFPVEVTLSTPGIVSSTDVYVLIYNTQTGQWEKLPAEAGNGTVSVKLNYLSVVAIVVDTDTLAGAGTSKSPKTGESSGMPYVLAAALLAGSWLCLRKKEA